jgi:putative transposase
MDNHYHLVLETPEANLGAGMQQLNSSFAQLFNKKHDRSGHLWERRYHAALLTTDAHLAEASRYVVLNPVRAGLCELPEEWPWSSYGATAGVAPCPSFLAVERVLAQLGLDRTAGETAYRDFVLDRL